ncbi:putative quinoprotein glucose/ sorbosone dehydrogenase [Candidatus Nitrososphaera gargensis Ga9.2]|uniref:Putative quinoprotein glucose/ sorbosone dehydrogenase n=1 Tax=Nitrososphaera gargensis (strain Ga9.2) TaxID=1237085 RepID=K0IJY2_NITGG|nr:PQQ-dependent sugar dehydrogenase [Candidatus Nitrososphaera gargensis]AFU58582.1 putative quinoprotein glucose/ sorbosone dehydrogenase [Candidatus Nitrososphaera gargensis Ga9.2]
MERKLAIPLLIIIAVAVVMAAVSISLGYAGLNNNDTSGSVSANGTFSVLPDLNPPTLSDAGLRVEKVIEGLVQPTSMAFLDHDDLLILQKNDGRVRHVTNGTLQPDPVHEVSVDGVSERGMLGVAVANATGDSKTVFLYYTESDGGEIRNRVYRHDDWSGSGNLGGGTLILDLPGEPGPNHDGGKMIIGPDGMLYTVIGDLNRNGMLQNFPNGPEPDDTSVIFRVDRDGNAVNNGTNNKYYAYGIRNSFGLDFDPLTGILWDTENGPAGYDEINVVEQGFNSGWEQIMGPIDRTGRTTETLVQFEGSHYADPVFSWSVSQGVTDIEFLNSTKLGDRYAYNIFVGDINNGNLYFFTVNQDRTGLEIGGAGLEDLVADSDTEAQAVTLGTNFGGITDIETGPDGHLYVLSFSGSLYRIVPAS